MADETTTSALGAEPQGGAQGTTEAKAPEATAEGVKAEAKQGEQQGEAQVTKEGGQAKANGAAPAEIEVKLPEGFVADEAAMGKFKTWAKERGLDSKGAQQALDMYVEAQSALVERQRTQQAEQVKQWVETIKTDKEVGGDQWNQKLEVARKAVQKFGTPELKALFDQGIGNHPELVRFAYRVGKALSSDSIAGTTANGKSNAPTDPEKAWQQALYGKSSQTPAQE